MFVGTVVSSAATVMSTSGTKPSISFELAQGSFRDISILLMSRLQLPLRGGSTTNLYCSALPIGLKSFEKTETSEKILSWLSGRTISLCSSTSTPVVHSSNWYSLHCSLQFLGALDCPIRHLNSLSLWSMSWSLFAYLWDSPEISQQPRTFFVSFSLRLWKYAVPPSFTGWHNSGLINHWTSVDDRKILIVSQEWISLATFFFTNFSTLSVFLHLLDTPPIFEFSFFDLRHVYLRFNVFIIYVRRMKWGFGRHFETCSRWS